MMNARTTADGEEWVLQGNREIVKGKWVEFLFGDGARPAPCSRESKTDKPFDWASSFHRFIEARGCSITARIVP